MAARRKASTGAAERSRARQTQSPRGGKEPQPGRRTTGGARSSARNGGPTKARTGSSAKGSSRAAGSKRGSSHAAGPARGSGRKQASGARRRLGPRQGPSRIRWDRLGRIALVLVLLAIGVSYLNPAVDLLRSHESASEAQQNLEHLAAQNQRLQERADSVLEQSVLTREARRQGMVMPGERPYVIRDLGG